MDPRPVLYLDIDDTIISWRGGEPRAAPGARQFLLWVIGRFEVRWLTTWCPGGEMESGLLHDLGYMLRLDVAHLASIRGFAWEGTGSKLNGIAWLEHLVHGRPFIWLEDEYGFGPREQEFLAAHRLHDSYQHVNVTEDLDSLAGVQSALGHWLDALREAAA